MTKNKSNKTNKKTEGFSKMDEHFHNQNHSLKKLLDELNRAEKIMHRKNKKSI